jgi:hypothetical protein
MRINPPVIIDLSADTTVAMGLQAQPNSNPVRYPCMQVILPEGESDRPLTSSACCF